MSENEIVAGRLEPLPAHPPSDASGRRFAGRFTLLRTLGRGGMGEVFLARERSTGAECALKRLDAYVGSGISDLAREFEALSRIHHPAVVRVHDFGVAPDGTPFYTMEYVPGEPADRAIARGDWPGLAHVGAEVAHALEVLHAAGIAHGDLKPTNVLVRRPADRTAPPEVKLLDFGLAALLGGMHAGGRGHAGTPGFAAPERVRGAAPGVASDLYGLGATLYTLATGRPPFEGDSVQAILSAQQAGSASGAALEHAPAGLSALILRLLAPDATDRPRDAHEVRLELEHLFPAVQRPLAARLQSAVFVGRETEFARIERLAMARSGPRLAFVAGESGLGKSALLGEVAMRANLAGRPVVRLSCAAFDGPGRLAEALAARLAAESGAEDAPLPEGDALADAAATWLEEIGRRGRAPVLLLDDAERLDATSARFVRRIALSTSSEHWLVVLCGRPDGARAVDPDRLLREGGSMEWIALDPLSRNGVDALVAARLRAPAPESLAHALWAHAQGHPGLTVELLLLAADRGALREDESRLVVDADRLRDLGQAGDFIAAMGARLGALPPAARSAGEALAVWGGPAEPARISALEPQADARAVAALVESRLCVYDDAGRVAWASPSMADQVVAGMDVERGRRLHAAILEMPDLSPASRFRHLSRAGRATEALAVAEEAFGARADFTLAEEAARLAERQGTPAAAADWWDRVARHRFDDGHYPAAIEAFASAMAHGLEGVARVESLHAMALALNRVGRLDDALARVREGLALNPPPALEVRLLAAEASVYFLKGDAGRAETLARSTLAAAQLVNDPEAIGWAAHVIALVLSHVGRIADAEPLFDLAQESFLEAKHVVGSVRAKIGKAVTAHGRRRFEESRRLCLEALEEAKAGGSRLAIVEALSQIVTILVPMGRWQEARDALLECMRIAFEDQRPPAAAASVANLALLDGLMGQPAMARQHARRGIRLAREAFARFESTAWRGLAQAERSSGRLRRAEPAARHALRAAQRAGAAVDLCWSRIEYGLVLEARGSWDEARRVWERAADRGPAGDPVGSVVILALGGRAALRSGDLASARASLAAASAILTDASMPFASAHANALVAGLALAEGRSLVAREEARRALDTFASLPAPMDRAETAVELAGLAMRQVRADDLPVGEWLDQAAATFDRLGNRRGRARALALQVQWLKRGGASRPVPAKERDLLQAVSRLLDSILDLRELTHRAMRLAIEQLGAERGVLLLADPGSGRLMPMIEHGDMDAEAHREAVGYSRRVAEQVAASGGSLLIGDAPAEPGALSQSMVDLRLRSIVCVPLFMRGRVIGAVYLDDSRRSDAFGDSERALLEGFAHLMAVAIEKSRGHEAVQRANDELVGENLSLRKEVATRFRTHRVIGSSEAVRRVLAVVERAAATSASVLITGENGTGKELIARVLHHSGKRHMQPFLSVNCGAIPEHLLESELFGILPNVATGVRGRDGRFKQADGGTLFLDEVGDMPPSQQVALLSVLANREVTPVGGHEPIPVDVRVIAATNRDLRKMIEDQTFREDLFYRLNVIPIEVPPLRERKADIPALAQHFVDEFSKTQERPVPEMSPEFLAALMQSDWAGNIRELQNYIERVLAMTSGLILYPTPPPRDLESRLASAPLSGGRRLTTIVEELDRRLVQQALETAGGNQSLAARDLGIPEQAIRYRVRKYGIEIARQKKRDRQK